MRKLIFIFLFGVFSITGYSQLFPGLNLSHKKKLLATGIKIPLPTWLPAGFSLDTFETRAGKNIQVQDKVLYVQYTKKLNDSTWQSVMIEAGFDGIGSLSYDRETIQSPLGKIEFYYQPFEKIDGKKEKKVDLISTEWFEVNTLPFHLLNVITIGNEFEILGDDDESEKKYNYIPLSKDDFKKIIESLQILK